MKIANCLYCYQPLTEGEPDFHTVCSKKMFSTKQAPIIEFNLKELEELAKQIVIKSVAVTGVQPKLSLELEKHPEKSGRIITPYHCRFAWQLYFKTTINRI
jgi:serine/threonine-protein kinase HipA